MATAESSQTTEFSGILLATSGPYTERMFFAGPEGGLIGRSRKCKISLLHDCEVSHNHAVIELQRGALCIRDVGSTFGTYLNDKRLSEPKRASESHKLKPCDSIKVGQTSLRWWPISSIRCAASVTIPHVLSAPSDYVARVPSAVMPADDHDALKTALTLQYRQAFSSPLSLPPRLSKPCLHPNRSTHPVSASFPIVRLLLTPNPLSHERQSPPLF